MSYSHDQRRKLIRRLKRRHGYNPFVVYIHNKKEKWYTEFRAFAMLCVKEKEGGLIGTVELIVNHMHERRKDE